MNDDTILRIRIDLAYDGTSYHGWATQPGLPTVQETVEAGLATIFRLPVAVTVAGRTDAGAHAANQVIHFDIAKHRWHTLVGNAADQRPEEATAAKLSGGHAKEAGAIRILNAQQTEREFAARFAPLSRRHRSPIKIGTPAQLTRHFTYHHRKPVEVGRMATEVQGLTGLHDFGAFCKPRPGATTIRTLHNFELETIGDLVIVHLAADAFCHHMVRALVGALLQVGDGTRPPGWLR